MLLPAQRVEAGQAAGQHDQPVHAALAQQLDARLAIIAKRRPEPNRSEVISVVGEVDGKCCIVIDDIIDDGEQSEVTRLARTCIRASPPGESLDPPRDDAAQHNCLTGAHPQARDIRDIRGKGLLIGVELVKDRASKE